MSYNYQTGHFRKKQFIDSIVYESLNNRLISKIYVLQEEMDSFKGFHLCAIDSSIVKIPNTKLTREEFGMPKKHNYEKILLPQESPKWQIHTKTS